jgi:hypothetical protein
MAKRFGARGHEVARLDMRVPSFEHLRLSAMIAATRAALGGERDRAIVFGSSLGGLTAARAAALDARVVALVLMAPAFRLVPRWRERLGEAAKTWETSGFLEVDDYATKQRARVDYGFVLDVEALDREDDGLPDVRVPTLIVHGVQDDVVPVEGSRAFSLDKPHVRLIEVEDGHELGRSIERIGVEAESFLRPWIG